MVASVLDVASSCQPEWLVRTHLRQPQETLWRGRPLTTSYHRIPGNLPTTYTPIQSIDGIPALVRVYLGTLLGDTRGHCDFRLGILPGLDPLKQKNRPISHSQSARYQ